MGRYGEHRPGNRDHLPCQAKRITALMVAGMIIGRPEAAVRVSVLADSVSCPQTGSKGPHSSSLETPSMPHLSYLPSQMAIVPLISESVFCAESIILYLFAFKLALLSFKFAKIRAGVSFAIQVRPFATQIRPFAIQVRPSIVKLDGNVHNASFYNEFALCHTSSALRRARLICHSILFYLIIERFAVAAKAPEARALKSPRYRGAH
jgi:hypothetical protein